MNFDNLDLGVLNMGEVETIENLTDKSVFTIANPNKPQASLLSAVAFVVLRRTNPDVSLEDVKKLTFKEVSKIATPVLEAMGSDDEVDEKKE